MEHCFSLRLVYVSATLRLIYPHLLSLFRLLVLTPLALAWHWRTGWPSSHLSSGAGRNERLSTVL